MHHQKLAMRAIVAFAVVGLAAVRPAGGQTVRRDTVPRTVQRPVPPATQRPLLRASVDSLVECSPVAGPAKAKPVVRRRKRVAPAGAVTRKPTAPRVVVAKPTKKPVRKVASVKPKRPIVKSVRRTIPAAARGVPARTTTVVMCRPVRPMAPLAMGTPVEQSVIPVPQLATATPAPVMEEGPPLIVSTAPGIPINTVGNGRSWLPFALIPAVFFPFIHSGTTNHGGTPVDTTTPPTTPPPTTPPPTTPPPTNPPPTPPPTTPPPTTPPTTPPPTTPPTTPPPTTPPTTPPPFVPPPFVPPPFVPPPYVPPPTDTTSLPPTVPPTTVPEPSTIVLLGSGLMGLAGVAKRRKKR